MEPMQITYGTNYHCGVYQRPYWQIDKCRRNLITNLTSFVVRKVSKHQPMVEFHRSLFIIKSGSHVVADKILRVPLSTNNPYPMHRSVENNNYVWLP
jgi:hypothetical protein